MAEAPGGTWALQQKEQGPTGAASSLVTPSQTLHVFKAAAAALLIRQYS
jgi:hypothetical protein